MPPKPSSSQVRLPGALSRLLCLQTSACLLIFLLAFSLMPASASEVAADPIIPWRSLKMEGKKLFVKFSSSVQIEIIPKEVAESLLDSGAAQAPISGKRVILLESHNGSSIGRSSLVKLYLNDGIPSILRRDRLRLNREKSQFNSDLYTPDSIRKTVRRPHQDEWDLDPAFWSGLREAHQDYPEGAREVPISSTDALPYLAALAKLQEVGESAHYHILAENNLGRITLKATEAVRKKASFLLTSASGTRKVKEHRDALRLLVSAKSLAGPRAGEEIHPFGRLRGTLEILLDRETLGTLELTGKIAKLGKIKLRLKALTLSESEDTETEAP